MEVKEIKTTRTIEEVVSTQYIAIDGTIFYDKAECMKYEESALCAVKKNIKWLSRNNTLCEINDEGCSDYRIDIADVQTEGDLKNLRQYIYLSCKGRDSDKADAMAILDKVTLGHPVLIMWNYDMDCCWTYGDGSPEAYGDYFKKQYLNVIKRNNKDYFNEEVKTNVE
jgi:hypothetical protein